MPAPENDPEKLPPAPSGECRAVVDVGTNSVKLLVAHVDGSRVDPIVEKGNQTRLGDGFFATRRLRPDAIARTARAVAAFRDEARSHAPARFRTIATAAAREAENRTDLLLALESAAGVPVEIISGDLEAEWAFRGVSTLPGLGEPPLLVADVGGGSTELIVGRAGRVAFRRSFPVGAVRLLENLRVPGDPVRGDLEACRTHLDAWLTVHAHDAVREALDGVDGTLEFVGVGGTASVLACMILGLVSFDRNRIESTRISPGTLTEWTEKLWSLPLAERRRIPGLPPERADVILTGAAIYEALIRNLRLPALRPSTRGLRFAALIDAR
ncbi:MAG: hypothetical protein JNL97_08395 [Verrucomicrobiales bacterium]|nr:hypothetical protein [Verrucomicrobiales bacterium]